MYGAWVPHVPENANNSKETVLALRHPLNLSQNPTQVLLSFSMLGMTVFPLFT